MAFAGETYTIDIISRGPDRVVADLGRIGTAAQAAQTRIRSLRTSLRTLDAQTTAGTRASRNYARGLDATSRRTTAANAAVVGYTASSRRLNTQTNITRRSLAFFRAGLVAVASAAVVGRFVQILDVFPRLRAQLNLVTNDLRATTAAYAAIRDVSLSTGTNFETNVTLFVRMRRALAGLNGTFRETVALTRTVARVGILSGASPQELVSGIRQFTQGLGSGLQGEELRSVVENLPFLAGIIAREVSRQIGRRVTGGQLIGLNRRDPGFINRQLTLTALQNEEARVAEQARNFPLTIGRAFENLTTAFTDYIGQAGEASSVTRRFIDALQFMTDNIGFLVNTVLGLASAALLQLGVLGPVNSLVRFGQNTRLTGAAGAAAGGAAGLVSSLIATILARLGTARIQSIANQATIAETVTPFADNSQTGRLADPRTTVLAAGSNNLLTRSYRGLLAVGTRVLGFTRTLTFLIGGLAGAGIGALVLAIGILISEFVGWGNAANSVWNTTRGLAGFVATAAVNGFRDFRGTVLGVAGAFQDAGSAVSRFYSTLRDNFSTPEHFELQNLIATQGSGNIPRASDAGPVQETAPAFFGAIGRFFNRQRDENARIRQRAFERNTISALERLQQEQFPERITPFPVFARRDPAAEFRRIRLGLPFGNDTRQQEFISRGNALDTGTDVDPDPGEIARAFTRALTAIDRAIANVSPIANYTQQLDRLRASLRAIREEGTFSDFFGGISQADLLRRTERALLGVNNAENDRLERTFLFDEALRRNIITQQEYNDEIFRGRDIARTAEQAFREYSRNIQETSGGVGGAITSSLDNATDSLTTFIREGAMGGEVFRNFANTIITEFTRVAVQLALIRPLVQGITGLFFPGASAIPFGTPGGGPAGTPGFQRGGVFRGRGTGLSDSNLALIGDGEHITNAASTRRYLPQLRAINNGTAPTGDVNVVVNNNIEIAANENGSLDPEQIAGLIADSGDSIRLIAREEIGSQLRSGGALSRAGGTI